MHCCTMAGLSDEEIMAMIDGLDLLKNRKMVDVDRVAFDLLALYEPTIPYISNVAAAQVFPG